MRWLTFAMLLAATPAAAWPDRPISMVVPYSPGGSQEGHVRALAETMSRQLGQPVLVVNREGASGVVGMRFVAASPPDGHTLAITPMTAVVVQPHMLRNAGTEPDKFEAVCGTNENVLGVFLRADSALRDLPGLVAEGRKRALAFGSAGPNSLPFLGVWRIQRATGVEFTHIIYRGDPPHLNDLLGGRLDFSTGVVASGAELIEAGKLRLLGVFSARRHPDYPNVPTAREQGIDAEQLSQVGIYAPRGTPPAVLDRLEALCRSGSEDPGVLRAAAQGRVVVNYMPRTDFAALVRSEYGNYARILKELGVEPQ